jgi:hypothetical protein
MVAASTLPITVRSGSFEYAKSEMELALGNILSPVCGIIEQLRGRLPKILRVRTASVSEI